MFNSKKKCFASINKYLNLVFLQGSFLISNKLLCCCNRVLQVEISIILFVWTSCYLHIKSNIVSRHSICWSIIVYYQHLPAPFGECRFRIWRVSPHRLWGGGGGSSAIYEIIYCCPCDWVILSHCLWVESTNNWLIKVFCLLLLEVWLVSCFFFLFLFFSFLQCACVVVGCVVWVRSRVGRTKAFYGWCSI